MNGIRLRWLFLATVLLTIAMTMQWRISNRGSQKGIVALEFARNIQEAKDVTSDWNFQGAIANTYLDFLYIVVYSTFLFMAISRTAVLLAPRFQKLKYLAWLAPVAGIMDILENLYMFRFLYNPVRFVPAANFACLKFAIIGALALLLIIFCSIILLKKSRNRKEHFISY